MPTLPDLNITTRVNHSPHVVILGAGCSKAAFPRGDPNGRIVPVMQQLIECLDLTAPLKAAGFVDPTNFEAIYWNAIVGNGGQESQCGWCKTGGASPGRSTPRVLMDALAAGGSEAKRAFEAMMPIKKSTLPRSMRRGGDDVDTRGYAV
jgi:hypothetical protein